MPVWGRSVLAAGVLSVLLTTLGAGYRLGAFSMVGVSVGMVALVGALIFAADTSSTSGPPSDGSPGSSS